MTVEDTILAKLTAAFAPESLAVENDSARHAGHASAAHHARGPGVTTGQTHFNVVMVAAAFAGKSRVERSRMVHDALKDELAGSVHALALKLSAPGEGGGRGV
jgi:BolA family transcriptional regulator, general stress-responsive regulator